MTPIKKENESKSRSMSPSSRHKIRSLPDNISSLFLLSLQDDDDDRNMNNINNPSNVSQIEINDENMNMNESALSNIPSPRLIVARNFDRICENGQVLWKPPEMNG